MTAQNHTVSAGAWQPSTAGRHSSNEGPRASARTGSSPTSEEAPDVGPYRSTLWKDRHSGRPLRVYDPGAKVGWYFGIGILTMALLTPVGVLSLVHPWLAWPVAVLSAAADAAGIWFLTRIFRAPNEPAASRPVWKATGTVASSRFVAQYFAIVFVIDVVSAVVNLSGGDLAANGFPALVSLAGVIFYGRSWRRMAAGDFGQDTALNRRAFGDRTERAEA